MPPSCTLLCFQRALLSTEQPHTARAAAVRLSQDSPRCSSAVSRLCVHSPGPGPVRLVCCANTRVSFHPRGLSPPRWLAPHGRSQACCIPLPAMKFAAFPASGIRWTRAHRTTVAFPATLHPSKDSPSPKPYRITAAAPFLTFARSRVSARLRPDTKASSPHVTECVNRNLRTGRTLTPPLGGWAHCRSSVASCWPSVSRCRASSTTLRAPQVRHGERGKPAPSAFASTTGVVHDRVAPAYLLRRREFPLGGLQDRCATVLVFKVSHRGEVRSVAPCCQ